MTPFRIRVDVTVAKYQIPVVLAANFDSNVFINSASIFKTERPADRPYLYYRRAVSSFSARFCASLRASLLSLSKESADPQELVSRSFQTFAGSRLTNGTVKSPAYRFSRRWFTKN